MKIIRQGRHPDAALLRGGCGACGTVIECTRGECKAAGEHEYPAPLIYSCPTCQQDIHLRDRWQGTALDSPPPAWQEKD